MNKLYVTILFIGMVVFGYAQKSSQYILKKNVRLTGKIIKKNWSKTSESYCAQGAGYYTFQLKNTTDSQKEDLQLVIALHDNSNDLDLGTFMNKIVYCEGQLMRKKIKINQEDGGQHPVTITLDGSNPSDYFECEIFRISSIKLVNK